MHTATRLLAILLALACCACPSPSAAADEPPGALVFALISTESAEGNAARWQPLLDDLGRAIGARVVARSFDDYAGAIWAMRADKAQLAWMGNKAAIEAVDHAGGEVMARWIDINGDDGYRSCLIVRADSDLASVDDVLARAGSLTFGDGDPNSTSGHVVPGYYIFATRGLVPEAIFKRVTRGNHEENLLAVAEGRADAATGNTLTLRRLRSLHPDAAGRVRVIWTSPTIPLDPLLWRADLDPALKAATRAFLTGYGREAPGKSPERLRRERDVLAPIGVSGFAPADNTLLTPVRKLELFRRKLSVESDAALPESRRREILAEIGERIRLLERLETEQP